MQIKSRKAVVLGLVILFAGYLLYRFHGSLNLSEFSVARLWQSLKEVSPPYVVAAVLVIYICYFLRALRWRNFQRHVGNADLLQIFKMTLAGFSAVFLFSRVGEAVRPVLISRKEKVPLADVFGIYALERFLDLGFAGVLLGAWIAIGSLHNFFYHDDPMVLIGVRKTATTILGVGVLVAAAIFFYVRAHGGAVLGSGLHAWVGASGWKAAVARVVLGIGRGLKTIRSWRDLTYALSVSALHWFLIILVYYLVCQGFGGALASLRFQDCMLVLALTLVGSLFQLPGIGGGPQAVMIGAFTGFYGVPPEPAFAAAMIIYLVTFAVCTFVGVPVLLKEGLSFGDLKRMRQQETAEIDAEIAMPNSNQ